jgi:hypothetical protein
MIGCKLSSRTSYQRQVPTPDDKLDCKRGLSGDSIIVVAALFCELQDRELLYLIIRLSLSLSGHQQRQIHPE